MSSSSSVHPPYAMPCAHAARGASLPTFEAFAAPAPVRAPYVPPDARVLATTAVIDAPDEAALVPGVRLGTPLPVPIVALDAGELPSIEQFLLKTPVDNGAATMAALFSTTEADTGAVVDALDALIDAPDEREAAEPTDAHDEPRHAPHDEPWAIADATDAVAELADGLAGRTGAELSAAEVVPEPVAPLEPWTDDEGWMDIMPALQTPGGPDLAGETAWARAFAEPPAPMSPAPLPAGDTEAAAASLEAIARRLRAGELDIPGYRGDRGDAAALAAALSALLGAGS